MIPMAMACFCACLPKLILCIPQDLTNSRQREREMARNLRLAGQQNWIALYERALQLRLPDFTPHQEDGTDILEDVL